MKETTIAAALISAFSMSALAQIPAAEGDTPAVATPDSKNATAPVAGENSFTEEQARDRITQAGFTAVSALKLDSKGVWRGTAKKEGKSVPVSLDYQGNIVAQ